MKTMITDGGREAAGYSQWTQMGNHVQDCLPIAIAIASKRSYGDVRSEIEELIGGSCENGIDYQDGVALIELFGFSECPIDEATIRFSRSRGHVIAVIDGVPHDVKEVGDLTHFQQGWR